MTDTSVDSSFDQAALEADLNALAGRCDFIKEQLEKLGPPAARMAPHGFETLLRTLVGQQISTKAAASIYKRFTDRFNGAPSAADIAALNEEDLRALGLSRQKIGYASGLARATLDGALDIEAWPSWEDEDIVKQITALKGFGRWSAEIYLMFSLGRRDVWPADDLALQIGLERLMGLEERPKSRKKSEPLIDHWRPYRSAGSLMLWHFYGSATLDS